MSRGVPGVLHGARSLFLQDEDGQILEAHSISAGLDYPGVGPEHAQLAAAGRASYVYATDDEAVAGFQLLSVTEGIVPALEPAHAIGWLAREAGRAVPARLDGAGHALGPGRQGRRPDRRAAHRRAARDRSAARRICGPGARPGASSSSRTSPAASAATGSTSSARIADAGADAVEIGIPFSDPVMDGLTIQEASRQRARAAARRRPA